MDYRLTNTTKLEFQYERENIERSYREVEETNEDKYRLNLVNRNPNWGTLRVELEYNSRDFKGDYNYNPYEEFWTEHLLHEFVEDPSSDPALVAAGNAALASLVPHTLSDLRKYDLAERDQLGAAIKLNIAIDEKTDLLLNVDVDDDDYSSNYGLKNYVTSNYGIEVSRAVSKLTHWYASYHFQTVESDMANIDAVETGSGSAAGSTFYPLTNAWATSEDEDSHFFNAGIETSLSPTLRLSLLYSYGLSDTSVNYEANTAAALIGAIAGRGGNPKGSFDDLSYQQQILQVNVRGDISEQLSWRLFAQYEIGKIDDFYYNNISYAENAKLLLGTKVEDWESYTGGILLQYQF